jgi:hypothetical protein
MYSPILTPSIVTNTRDNTYRCVIKPVLCMHIEVRNKYSRMKYNIMRSSSFCIPCCLNILQVKIYSVYCRKFNINQTYEQHRYRLHCRYRVFISRLVRRPEHLVFRHWYLPANWRSFIRWSRDQWASHCYDFECDRSFYCALFCVFMTRVSQCPISLRAEHPMHSKGFGAADVS